MRLNASFRADLEWWHAFVSEWNGVALLQGVELEKERGKVEVWMDASGSWGCGTLWDGQWLQVAWSEWPVLVRLTFQPRSCFPLLWQRLLGAVTGEVEWWFAIVTTRRWWQL